MSTDDQPPDVDPQTQAIIAGRRHNGDALPPTIVPSTTFETATVDEALRRSTSPGEVGVYSRYGNPTVTDFQEAVAALEGAEAGRAFASGMGALFAAIFATTSKGNHIVAQKQLYANTTMLFLGVCPRFGIEVTFVDGTEPGAFEAAMRPGQTTLLFAETPANPQLDLIDLEAFGAIKGPIKVVDSTFATPMAQRPLEYGADLVVHSATKAISGHNDASLGVVCGSAELINWIWGFAILQGANASPYDAANGLRGLRTLPVRFRQQSESAHRLAETLEVHAAVDRVRYPGLPSHPQHDLAKRQMRQMGGLIAMDLAGGIEAGRKFVESVNIARHASSLGGPETLVTHPASTTHAGLLEEELEAAGIGPGTIRVSVGLEHADDLIADFAQALDRS